MKKASYFIIALALTGAIAGCGNREPVDKKPQEYKKPVLESGNESQYTAGIKDAFNTANGIESTRKKRVTQFGRLAHPPKTPTPDEQSINEALNAVGKMKLKVGTIREGTISIPSFPFDYENDTALLAALFKEHALDKIITKKMTSLDLAQALNIYTYSFFKDGVEPSADTWMKDTSPSAFAITAAKRNQNIGGRSEHYAALLCQLSLSCGFVSRIIGMHTIADDGSIVQHTACEIFLNSFDKWVLFDPYTEATYYVRDNTPLSALELRTVMLNNLYRDVQPIVGAGDFSDIVTVREKILPCYKYLYIYRMNDILGKSGKNASISWQELFSTHLVWEDGNSLVVNGKFDQIGPFSNKDDTRFPLDGVKYVAHDKNDMYWKVNQTVINVERLSEDKLRLSIDSFTPNFDYFDISYTIENTKKQFRTKNGVFEVNSSMVDLNVSILNTFGVPSAPLEIGIAAP